MRAGPLSAGRHAGTDWHQRQSRIVLRLRELAPDIIGLQEVWATNSTTQANVSLGVAVLSRWPITDVDERRLPARHRPHDPVALRATID